MSGPDKFDPTMDLSHAKNVMDGPHSAPSGTESNRIPGDVQSFDGAATTARNIAFPGNEKPLSTPNQGGPPAGVDQFNGGAV